MFIIEWYRQWKSAKAEFSSGCETCGVLRHELEVVRLENHRLLDRILEKPSVEVPTDTTDMKPINLGLTTSWRVKRQMLEAEDREKAKLLRDKESEMHSSSGGMKADIAELEKEMDLATEKRESKVS